MKKLKFALAGVALVTAALTMSFTSSNDGKDSAQQNDCWSTVERHQNNEAPDRSTSICPDLNPGCCVKPDPANPGQYLEFSEL